MIYRLAIDVQNLKDRSGNTQLSWRLTDSGLEDPDLDSRRVIFVDLENRTLSTMSNPHLFYRIMNYDVLGVIKGAKHLSIKTQIFAQTFVNEMTIP